MTTPDVTAAITRAKAIRDQAIRDGLTDSHAIAALVLADRLESVLDVGFHDLAQSLSTPGGP
jgi:hypothetical protein